MGGEGFAVDASLIEADANKCRSIPGGEWNKDIDPETARRAVKEYLATLDDPAYGAASEVTPKFISPSDPAAQWTGALRNAAFFAYADDFRGRGRCSRLLIEIEAQSGWLSILSCPKPARLRSILAGLGLKA